MLLQLFNFNIPLCRLVNISYQAGGFKELNNTNFIDTPGGGGFSVLIILN